MDNRTAKEILAAYRPNGQDAQDSKFKDALDQVRNDPAMAKWAEAEQAFDRSAVKALARISGPSAGKASILGTASFDSADTEEERAPERPAATRRFWYLGTGIAAALILGLLLWTSLPKPVAPVDVVETDTPDALTVESAQPVREPPSEILEDRRLTLSRFASLAMPIMQVSDDYAELTAWLEANNGPIPSELPAFFDNNVVGCTLFDDGFGGKLAILCFYIDGALVHVFVMEPSTQERLQAPLNEWWGEGDWMLYAWEAGPQKLALATLADPMPIDALLRQGG